MEPNEKIAEEKTVSNPEYQRLFDEIIQLTHGAKFLLEVNEQAQETAQLREENKKLKEQLKFWQNKSNENLDYDQDY